MMARPEKEAMVAELKEKLATASTAVLTDYRGLNVAALTKLRRKLREAGVEFKIVKNTLTLFAAKEIGLDDLKQFLEGPTAIAFSYEDPVAPAKLLVDFTKEHKQLEVKGGVLQGKVIQKERVKDLAGLPPREVMLAKVLGGMRAPITGLVYVLSGTTQKLVYVLDAIRQQKEIG